MTDPPHDLARLALERPDWTFGSDWATAGSGPDHRYVWAIRDGEELRATDAEALAALLPQAQPSGTRQGVKPSRLALDDPAALAWGARLLQAALERRRNRLAAAGGDGDHDGAP